MDEKDVMSMTNEEIIEARITFSVFGEPHASIILEMMRKYPGIIRKLETAEFPPEKSNPGIWVKDGKRALFAISLPLLLVPEFNTRCGVKP